MTEHRETIQSAIFVVHRRGHYNRIGVLRRWNSRLQFYSDMLDLKNQSPNFVLGTTLQWSSSKIVSIFEYSYFVRNDACNFPWMVFHAHTVMLSNAKEHSENCRHLKGFLSLIGWWSVCTWSFISKADRNGLVVQNIPGLSSSHGTFFSTCKTIGWWLGISDWSGKI